MGLRSNKKSTSVVVSVVVAFKATKKPPVSVLTSGYIWRTERDSNPRYAINVYTSSSRAP